LAAILEALKERGLKRKIKPEGHLERTMRQAIPT
jgi:hypothetical protein